MRKAEPSMLLSDYSTNVFRNRRENSTFSKKKSVILNFTKQTVPWHSKDGVFLSKITKYGPKQKVYADLYPTHTDK